MDRLNNDHLERLLTRKVEIAFSIWLAIPVLIELLIRYGINDGLLYWVGILSVYALLQYLRFMTKPRPPVSYIVTLLNYIVVFLVITWLLSVPLSPLIVGGVIAATLLARTLSTNALLWSTIIFSLSLMAVFLLQHGNDFELDDFSQLLSVLATMSLLILFSSELIGANQGEISEVNETYNKLKAEHLRLVSLVNTLGDAVIATDNDGAVQTYNGAALELLDTNSSLSGKRIDDVWNLVDAQGRQVRLIDEAKRVNTSFRRSDLIIKYGADDQANLYINVTPLKAGFGKGAQQGYTFIMRDITKEKSLDEERDEFVSVVSHELRTPVTITEGKISNAQLLLSKPEVSSKNLNESLKAAHEQVVFLANMINDLASLARAEREDTELDLEKVDPAELINQLKKTYEPEAKQKNLTISTRLPLIQLDYIYTSRLYLQEILQNFITNSIKYTKEGGITLSVMPARGGIQFSVSDTGIGINTSDMKKVFDKFFRSEDYRTRENSGTGLGLYVTMKLAKKIKAKIDVQSKINEGSTFFVTVSSMPDNTQ